MIRLARTLRLVSARAVPPLTIGLAASKEWVAQLEFTGEGTTLSAQAPLDHGLIVGKEYPFILGDEGTMLTGENHEPTCSDPDDPSVVSAPDVVVRDPAVDGALRFCDLSAITSTVIASGGHGCRF